MLRVSSGRIDQTRWHAKHWDGLPLRVYCFISLSCPPIIGLVLLIQSYINPTSSSQCLVNLSTGHATHCGNWPIRTLDTQGIAAGCPYMYVISFALFCRPFFSTTRRSASTALTVVAYLSVHLSHESLVRKNVDTASSQHVWIEGVDKKCDSGAYGNFSVIPHAAHPSLTKNEGT